MLLLSAPLAALHREKRVVDYRKWGFALAQCAGAVEVCLGQLEITGHPHAVHYEGSFSL